MRRGRRRRRRTRRWRGSGQSKARPSTGDVKRAYLEEMMVGCWSVSLWPKISRARAWNGRYRLVLRYWYYPLPSRPPLPAPTGQAEPCTTAPGRDSPRRPYWAPARTAQAALVRPSLVCTGMNPVHALQTSVLPIAVKKAYVCTCTCTSVLWMVCMYVPTHALPPADRRTLLLRPWISSPLTDNHWP